MMLTRVVELARVSAIVNSAHMAALKRRFRPKKAERRSRSRMLRAVGEVRWRIEERAVDQVVVRDVVVLGCREGVNWGRWVHWVLEAGRGENIQLREDAVEGGAGAAGDGEEEPEGLRPEEGGQSVHGCGTGVGVLVEVAGHGGGE